MCVSKKDNLASSLLVRILEATLLVNFRPLYPPIEFLAAILNRLQGIHGKRSFIVGGGSEISSCTSVAWSWMGQRMSSHISTFLFSPQFFQEYNSPCIDA